MGKTLSRKLLSQSYQTSLPGAPDGQYVVIQYNASFEGKKSAIETVTPVLDSDGVWRVSGYYIKEAAGGRWVCGSIGLWVCGSVGLWVCRSMGLTDY